MPIKSLKRYCVILLIGLIGSLVSTQLVLAQQEELSLEEAVKNGQVTVVMDGIANDPIFTEPMVQLTLSNQTSSQLTVIIPKGLTLRSEQGYADLIILRTEPASATSVDLEPSQTSSPIQLFAYSLEYNKNFPDSRAEYQLEESIDISAELGMVLDNIIALGAEKEWASQLAVWLVYHKLTFDEFDQMFPEDYSAHSNRVNQILSGSTGFPPWFWPSLFGAIIVLIILATGVFLWNRQNRTYSWLDKVAGDEWQILTEGGMAEIWMFKDRRQKPHKDVIVKFAKKDEEQDTINARFQREIKIHQLLTHENIVKIIETGECRHPILNHNVPYMAQQRVYGCTVKQLLSREWRNRLPNEIIFHIVTQIMAAVEYIHDQGFVHRDITWTNVMVDKKGKVYLIDFGNVAKILSPEEEQDPEKNDTIALDLSDFGTPPFYPKQGISRHSPGMDFYALAVLIYALYGGTEFTDKELKELNGVPEQLKGTLLRCLAGQYDNVSILMKDLGLPRYKLSKIVETIMESTSPI